MAQKKSATKRPKRAAVNYISNPFGLIRPSLRAIQLNLWQVIGVLALGIIVVVGIVSAGAILLTSLIDATGHHTGLLIGCGVAALVLALILLAIVTPLATTVLLAGAQGRRVGWRALGATSRRFSRRLLGAGVLALVVALVVLAIALGASYFLGQVSAVLSGLLVVGLFVAAAVLGTWYSLAAFAIVDQDLGVFAGYRGSKVLVRHHLREMWGLYGLGGFLGFLPIIGGLISIVLVLLTLAAPAIRYEQLKTLPSDSESSLPAVHWANYLVIVLIVASALWGTLGGSSATTQPEPPSYYPTTAPS